MKSYNSLYLSFCCWLLVKSCFSILYEEENSSPRSHLCKYLNCYQLLSMVKLLFSFTTLRTRSLMTSQCQVSIFKTATKTKVLLSWRLSLLLLTSPCRFKRLELNKAAVEPDSPRKQKRLLHRSQHHSRKMFDLLPSKRQRQYTSYDFVRPARLGCFKFSPDVKSRRTSWKSEQVRRDFVGASGESPDVWTLESRSQVSAKPLSKATLARSSRKEFAAVTVGAFLV